MTTTTSTTVGGAQGTRPAGDTCSCGAPPEAIATDLPDQDGMLLFGDRPAHRAFCISCLAVELDDPHSPWVDVAAIAAGDLEDLLAVAA